MEVVRKKMLIKYWDDMYSIGHMALFLFRLRREYIIVHNMTPRYPYHLYSPPFYLNAYFQGSVMSTFKCRIKSR